jgi:hypothetical protein
MSHEELHGSVDIEKIEPVSVRIDEDWEGVARGRPGGSSRTYTVTYSLPIKVCKTWQYMFHVPDEMSGVVHQVDFSFSEDGTEVIAVLPNEPAPELVLVLKRYVERANRRWEHAREILNKNFSEEEEILKKLRQSP